MIIGCDIDGVLADFNTNYIDLVKREIGLVIPPVSSTFPDQWDYDVAAGLRKADRNHIWDLIAKPETQFWCDLAPLPGAREAVYKLDDLCGEGHEVYYITSRPGLNAQSQTHDWFLDNFGAVNCPIIIANSSTQKGQIAAALKLTHYIDDKPENCEAVKHVLPEARVVLLDASWNRNRELEGIPRVRSFSELFN